MTKDELLYEHTQQNQWSLLHQSRQSMGWGKNEYQKEKQNA
jgi:hypothetical protein